MTSKKIKGLIEVRGRNMQVGISFRPLPSANENTEFCFMILLFGRFTCGTVLHGIMESNMPCYFSFMKSDELDTLFILIPYLISDS